MVVSSKKKRNDRFGKLENAKLMSGIKREAEDHSWPVVVIELG